MRWGEGERGGGGNLDPNRDELEKRRMGEGEMGGD